MQFFVLSNEALDKSREVLHLASSLWGKLCVLSWDTYRIMEKCIVIGLPITQLHVLACDRSLKAV